MSKNVSTERQTTYYVGMLLMMIGGLLFASTFVSFISNFGDFSNFESDTKSTFGRALAGMAFLIVGGIVRRVGARGLAGSGLLLNPRRARGDLEPYSRMVGGLAKDALDEAGVEFGSRAPARERVIMIRCGACQTLNEEGSKFCQECGASV